MPKPSRNGARSRTQKTQIDARPPRNFYLYAVIAQQADWRVSETMVSAQMERWSWKRPACRFPVSYDSNRESRVYKTRAVRRRCSAIVGECEWKHIKHVNTISQMCQSPERGKSNLYILYFQFHSFSVL